MTHLAGKACLVTGASRGIGRMVAQTLAGAGARVLAVDREAEGLVSLAGEFPDGRVCALEADLLAADAADRIVAEALERLGAAVPQIRIFKRLPADQSAEGVE